MLEYRFAQLTLGATLLLLFIGATVHPTGSSLACPEWLFVPTCNYDLAPEMKGGVLYEHGHRLVAFLVGVFSVALALLVWRRRRADRLTVKLAVAAVGMVIVQGALGGLTVLLKLSAALSTAHLATAMAFMLLLWLIATRLAPARARPPTSGAAEATPPVHPRVRAWAFAALIAVYLQIVLGGVVRHTGASLTCIDLPFCGGELWPEPWLQRIHMMHRIGAVIASVLVLVAGVLAWRSPAARARGYALAMMLTLAAQFTLGVLSVVTYIQLHVVILHLMFGALLLAMTFAVYLRVRAASSRVTQRQDASAPFDTRQVVPSP